MKNELDPIVRTERRAVKGPLVLVLVVTGILAVVWYPLVERWWWNYRGCSVDLAWDPSPTVSRDGPFIFTTPPVAGYKIAIGKIGPEGYLRWQTVGNTNRVTIHGLKPGANYVFAAVAYTEDGTESELSNLVFFKAPMRPKAPVEFWSTTNNINVPAKK